jgi:hypothetical protein
MSCKTATKCVDSNLGYSDTEYQMTEWIANQYNDKLDILRSNNKHRRCFQILWKVAVPAKFTIDQSSKGPIITLSSETSSTSSQCSTVQYNVESLCLPDAKQLALILPQALFQKKSQNSYKRYTFLYLTLIHKIGSSQPTFHANGILLDSKYKTCERIEPYGCIPGSATVSANASLKRQLIMTSNRILDQTLSIVFGQYNYIAPCLSTPPVGPQRLQEQESRFQQLQTKNRKNNFKNFGFCTAWVIWMLQLRLEYGHPNMKLEIQRQLNDYARSERLTEYILNYTALVMNCNNC